ncbi:hypothetical protein GcC1_023048 [Golovinomyces cichoracearum]|uniref:Uncharacterized protein n=1 Tax=Golovinomyces cichoracearum TaxID=62708 RepID=A0A420J4B3_9PEZI|nr:hypothetical protein GcC1_023048 [Golovinomyces cichoracearum]
MTATQPTEPQSQLLTSATSSTSIQQESQSYNQSQDTKGSLQSNEEIINYVQKCLESYKEMGERDAALWEYVQLGFLDRDVTFWEKCDAKVRMALRIFLTRNEISVKPLPQGNGRVATQIATWLSIPEYHVWSLDEINYWRAHGGLRNSQWNPNDEDYDPALQASEGCSSWEKKKNDVNKRKKREEKNNGKGKDCGARLRSYQKLSDFSIKHENLCRDKKKFCAENESDGGSSNDDESDHDDQSNHERRDHIREHSKYPPNDSSPRSYSGYPIYKQTELINKVSE